MPPPFVQLPFAQLSDSPHRPHDFFALEERHVHVDSPPFGRVRVSYREAGSGPPLLLIHGLMTTGYSWRYVIGALAESFRVIVPDLVGCGRSDKPDCAYRARDVAAFVGALQRALDIRGCDVVGNSLGGYLSMWLALDDPPAMARLLNIHSPGVPLARLWALRTALCLPGASRLLRYLVGRDPLRWAHQNVHYYDESLKSLEEAREYGEPLREPAGVRAFERYLRDTLDPADMRAFVARLEADRFPVPLRLLYARRDPMVPPSVGPALHALVPAAELDWLDGASHFAHVDDPAAIVTRIRAFFAPH